MQSTNHLDTVKEVFTVDNGNVSCTGTININGGVLYKNGAPSSGPGSNGYAC